MARRPRGLAVTEGQAWCSGIPIYGIDGHLAPVIDFQKKRTTKSGLQGVCRQCSRERDATLKWELLLRYSQPGSLVPACSHRTCRTTEFFRLELDHIDPAKRNPDTRKNENSKVLFRRLRREGYPSGYQTLCDQCNQSKGMGAECLIDHDRDRRFFESLRAKAHTHQAHLIGGQFSTNPLLP